MELCLVAKVQGRTVIFGLGNTKSTAWAAGRWNAKEMGITDGLKLVKESMLPKDAIWFDKL
jgi:hypothetical protein